MPPVGMAAEEQVNAVRIELLAPGCGVHPHPEPEAQTLSLEARDDVGRERSRPGAVGLRHEHRDVVGVESTGDVRRPQAFPEDADQRSATARALFPEEDDEREGT